MGKPFIGSYCIYIYKFDQHNSFTQLDRIMFTHSNVSVRASSKYSLEISHVFFNLLNRLGIMGAQLRTR